MPRKVAVLLGGVVVVLLLANLVSYFALAADSRWARLLDVNQEENFATAFSVLLLLWCAILLWQVAKLRSGSQLVSYWRSLSFIFVAMAVDEGLLLHERLNAFLDDRFHTSGLLYYDWVIPGSLFVLLVGLIYARFLQRLSSMTRYQFLFAGGLYVLGALGMEMISGYYVDRYGHSNRAALALLNGIEESAEMFGLIAFIYALLVYIQRLRRLAHREKLHRAKLYREKLHLEKLHQRLYQTRLRTIYAQTRQSFEAEELSNTTSKIRNPDSTR